MVDEGDAAGSGLQRRDMIYSVVLAAGLGGERLLDRGNASEVDVLKEKVGALERNINELRDPGGPVLRETVQKLKFIDDKLLELAEVRKEADQELRGKIEALRSSIDSLRIQIERALAAPLVGPRPR